MLITDGYVVDAAPILKWAMGKRLEYLQAYATRKRWVVEHVALADVLGTALGARKLTKSSPKRSTQHIPAQEGTAPSIDITSLVDMFLAREYNSVAAQDDHREGYLSPSSCLVEDELVTHCYRRQVFQLICAPRSATNLPARVWKITDGGTARHSSLDAMFEKIASAGYIDKYESGKTFGLVGHGLLPTQGEFDCLITIRGWRYLFEYKTSGVAAFEAIGELHGRAPPKSRPVSKQDRDKAVFTDFKHKVQLNTYLGFTGVQVGYRLYEQNNVKEWLPIRQDFDAELFARTEDFVRAMTEWAIAEQLPAYDAARCDENVEGCPYVATCQACLDGVMSFQDADKRDEALKKRHLEVMQ